MRTLAALLLALPLHAAAPAFTLEQVLGSPFPSDLTASPRGDAVAWVMNAKGVRNVWVSRAPVFESAPVTAFTVDDGQDIEGLAWASDSSAIFFTRGGGVNGRSEFPNPTNNPAGVRQEIWVAPLNGQARRIGEGHSPTPAPGGAYVAWIFGGQVWSSSAAPDAKPAQLIHARGFASELTWSPEGNRLAFTSNRGDHAFIGVYDTAARSLLYLDPSVDSDQSPAWSPDGRQLGFIRIPASRYGSMHGAKRTGDPWSIRAADPATGKGRQIWIAEKGMGSVFWPMSAANQLLWGAGGEIVFPWERDGWLHLYAIVPEEEKATLLTPGNFEIEHAALASDGRSVVYSSNQGDIDRRHLWTTTLRKSNPRSLTSGEGIEWAPAPLATGIALLRSDARLPARPALLQEAKSVRDLVPASMPSDFPASSMTVPQLAIFSAADGMQIHGQIFLPPAGGAAKHPAVIFFHGGSRREMLLGWHYMFYYHQAYAFNQYLASRGYIVLSVNYRSGTGYGEKFREALNYGPTGASEFNDVLGAGRYLRGRPDVDTSRIGLWGGSYGGYLTALGLARASNLFAAGVDLHGVHDWNLEISNPLPAYEPEKRLAVARTAFESSPLSSISTWRSPVLLIQGDDDRNVVFSQTVLLAEALKKQGVYFEQRVFPDEVHDFLIHSHWLAVYNASAEFLNRFLKR